jgi:hypothetical protein
MVDSMALQTDNVLSPPYVAFSTFLSSLDRLKPGIPNQIDRSVWQSFSGAVQGQLLNAYRFLGLVDEHDSPTEDLFPLVQSDETHRKKPLASLLTKRYPSLIALDLTKATTKQLNDGIIALGVSGETAKKAHAFFLKAARFAEVPLSPLLLHKGHGPSTSRRPTNGQPERRRRAQPNEDRMSRTSSPQGAESKSIELRSGGNLTLTVSTSFLELSDEDMGFVTDLVRKMREYEKGGDVKG